MKHFFILWFSSFLLTFLTGYIYTGTSEFYPVTGTFGIDGKKISYRFEKVNSDKGDYKFIIRTDNHDIQADILWKKEKEQEWETIRMKKDSLALIGEIPVQNTGEKIIYFAEIYKDNKKYIIPDKPIKLLFLGYVPFMISFLSSFSFFGGLLLSFRTGLEFFNEREKIKKLSLFTATFFFVYTIAVTPLKKSYELDAINNKVVPITSLFDVQSILLFLIWVIVLVMVFKVKNPKQPAIIFSIITALIFLFIRF